MRHKNKFRCNLKPVHEKFQVQNLMARCSLNIILGEQACEREA